MSQKNQKISENESASLFDNLPAYICPIPVGTPVSQIFGARPDFYSPLGFLGHPGIDYACPFGTNINSSNFGIVLETGFQPKGWGRFIKINHGKYTTLYAHLSYIFVQIDCWVSRGEIIAKSGNTGLSSGPHLHFGIFDPRIYDNGYKGYFNPDDVLKLTEEIMSEQLKKITAEIAQIKKDNYDPKSLYIHIKYIEQILAGTK